jgi:hypothetical protein
MQQHPGHYARLLTSGSDPRLFETLQDVMSEAGTRDAIPLQVAVS